MWIAQNNRFCSKMYKKHQIPSKEFQTINWLLFYKRVHQCVNAITFKFANNACPYYLNDVYESYPQCRIESGSNFVKLKFPFWKTNTWQKGLSYTGSSLWNNLSGSMKKPPFWMLLNITWKSNILAIYLEARIDRIIINIQLCNLPIYLFICLFIYLFILFIYSFIYYSLLLI